MIRDLANFRTVIRDLANFATVIRDLGPLWGGLIYLRHLLCHNQSNEEKEHLLPHLRTISRSFPISFHFISNMVVEASLCFLGEFT